MRTKRIRFLLMFVLLADCAGMLKNPDATPRSPYEIAELTYAQGSLGYELGMTQIKAALDSGALGIDLWRQVYNAQTIVQQYAPMVRASLDLWRTSGVKPATLDETTTKLTDAFAVVKSVRSEVKP